MVADIQSPLGCLHSPLPYALNVGMWHNNDEKCTSQGTLICPSSTRRKSFLTPQQMQLFWCGQQRAWSWCPSWCRGGVSVSLTPLRAQSSQLRSTSQQSWQNWVTVPSDQDPKKVDATRLGWRVFHGVAGFSAASWRKMRSYSHHPFPHICVPPSQPNRQCGDRSYCSRSCQHIGMLGAHHGWWPCSCCPRTTRYGTD